MTRYFPRETVAKTLARRRRALLAALPALDPLEPRMLLSAVMATPNFIRVQPSVVTPASLTAPSGVSPTALRHAYGIDQISVNGVTGDGSGQTIAIVDAYYDPNITADLATFDSTFGLSDPTLTIMRQDGTLVTTSNHPGTGGWAGEVSLDVEWSHVIAPKANILLIEANSASYSDLLAGVQRASGTAGVSVVSMSWGGGEVNADSYFTQPGVTYFASSGDSGAGASSPATSVNVVAVGGTTLMVDSNGNLGSEQAWNGSGGGLSSIEAEPAYQKGVVPTSITTTARAEPDVSFDADPYSGVYVVDTYDSGGTGQYGGTSLSSPCWAALIAIANQERVAAGLPVLNSSSANATLPLLYGLSSADFRDITTNYTADYSGNAAYPAAVGYDLATGRGSPIANKLVADLVGSVATPNPAIGSLTVNPSSTTVGTNVTLTANNVTDPGATINSVAFYRESNGTAGVQVGGDTLVGTGTQSGGNWSLTISSSAMTAGTYTYYAVATDSAGVSSPIGTSAPSAGLTLSVPTPNPLIGSFAANPASVTAGTATTLIAGNVTDAGATITGVNFYRESNGTSGLQIGGDTLVGAGTKNGTNWSISASTTGLTVGTYTCYAVATDNAGVSSAVSSTTLNIVNAYTNLFTTDANINSPSPAGTSSFNSTTGVYTVTGAGSGIGSKSDQFNYDYASYSGNGSLVANIGSLTNANSSSQAGVMFRNSTASNSIYAAVVVTPSNGLTFEWRLTAGGNTSHVTITGIKAPVWVKLTRSGNNFAAYYSTSATVPTSWTQIGSTRTISMSTSALAGLAVSLVTTARKNTALCTATFANVQLGTSTLVLPAGTTPNPVVIPPDQPTASPGHDDSGNTGAALEDSSVSGAPSRPDSANGAACNPVETNGNSSDSANDASGGDFNGVVINAFRSAVLIDLT